MKKKILKEIIAAIIIMALGGCANMAEDFNKSTENALDEKGNAAIRYIQEKYGEEFTPITYGLGDYLSDVDVVECYPSWMNPEFEHVSVFIHNEEESSFGDNYFEFMKRTELEDSVKEVLASAFGDDIKLFQSCSESELPSELGPDNSVADLYKLFPNYTIWADAFIKDDGNFTDESFEDKVKMVKDNLCQTKKSYVLHLYVVDSETYEKLSREDKTAAMDAYEKNWEPDGEIVKNAKDIMITMGEVE